MKTAMIIVEDNIPALLLNLSNKAGQNSIKQINP